MDAAESSPKAEGVAPVAVFKKRGAKGKASIRRRPATPPSANSDSSDSDFSSSDDDVDRRVKRLKRTGTGAITASSRDRLAGKSDLEATAFTANRDVPISISNDATKQSNWYDDYARDVIPSKNLIGSSKSTPKRAEPDGTYKGLANQTSFIQRNPNAPQRTVGPIKAPTNIRTITVTDFAPDVCKDYKKTGFCGFGDNCKYLHSREDYKHGWQLDREWETITKGKNNLGGTVVASANRSNIGGDDDEEAEEDALLQNIPFACIICEENYKAPIITRCGHYFCEPCALKRYRRDPTCAACGSGTNGVFNSAKRLKRLLEKKREREAQRRRAALEAGEEVSDQEAEAV